MKFGQQFPLAYCLLPNKTRETYERVFELLKQKCADLDIEFHPTSVMSDFELAIIQAIQLAFPQTIPKGCYFHFCQCLTRQVQALGMQVRYREEQEIRTFIRKTAALAFVPVRYIRLAWQAIKAEAPNEPGTCIADFIAYFEQTWLVENYPPSLWNVFNMETVRTNNRVEGWNSKLKKRVEKAHPNVFEIVEVFKKEQAASEVSIQQLAAGAAPPRKQRQWPRTKE